MLMMHGYNDNDGDKEEVESISPTLLCCSWKPLGAWNSNNDDDGGFEQDHESYRWRLGLMMGGHSNTIHV